MAAFQPSAEADGSPYWIASPIVGMVVFGCLSLAAMSRAAVNALDAQAKFRCWRRRRLHEETVRDYIPHMTAKEREIIAYLLHHNQKVFQTHQDGGCAAPLIAKGVIRSVGVHGQVVDIYRVPFEIPDNVWKVLKANETHFSYSPSRQENPEPWAIPWMAR